MWLDFAEPKPWGITLLWSARHKIRSSIYGDSIRDLSSECSTSSIEELLTRPSNEHQFIIYFSGLKFFSSDHLWIYLLFRGITEFKAYTVSVQVFLCEGGRHSDCIENKTIIWRGKKVKEDTRTKQVMNTTNSDPLPFPSSFTFFHR